RMKPRAAGAREASAPVRSVHSGARVARARTSAAFSRADSGRGVSRKWRLSRMRSNQGQVRAQAMRGIAFGNVRRWIGLGRFEEELAGHQPFQWWRQEKRGANRL